MKKRILISMLIISCLCFMGCQKKQEEINDDETEVISVNVNNNIKNITELSKSEILSMSAEEVKSSVETYLPNYRNIYKIDSNKVMTDNDWINLRNIICIQFYGSASLNTAEGDSSYQDANAKYYAPTKESIEKLSLQEFAVYMNELYTYMYGQNYLATNNIDFTKYDETQLTTLKQEFIASIDK